MERDTHSDGSAPLDHGSRTEAVGRRAFLARMAALGAGAAATGVVSGLSAPGRATAQTTQKRELVVAQGGDIAHFDPHMRTAANDIRVSFNIFDNLVARRPDGKLYPGLATEWKVTGPQTYQFALRQGVRWHNGDPFTSADAKYSIERTYDPAAKTMVSTVLATIERIETPDAATLLIHTKKPDPLLPARLSFYGGQIVPKRYLEQVGMDGFARQPIGTGPLRFASWVKDDRTVLEANPDYWGGRVDVDRVVFRPIPETAARLAALLKGEVDLITALPPDQYERVSQHPTTQVASTLYAGLYVFNVNSKVPPLNDPRIKQALSLGLDRQAIARELWRGRATVATGPIARGDNHFDPALPPLPYDPNAARDLVKKAGYKNEPIYVEVAPGYTANDRAVSEAAAAMWKDIGLNPVVEIIEYSVRAQRFREKALKGLVWLDPTSTLGDPDGMMWRLLAPGAPLDYWRHAEFDELGNAARFSLDEKFRGEAYRKMTKIFLEHNPWILVLQPQEDYGLQRHVEFTPNSNQQLELRRFNFRMKRA